MKLPDSEPLASDEYWVIVDQWKQERESGVQVPVNPDSLPEPSVTIMHCNNFRVQREFKLPKNKYISITKDENFKPDEHVFSHAPTKSESACSYDLDECDVAWLRILNAERASAGLSPVYENQLERVVERLELCCWEKIQSILRNAEGLGIEYDENVICDVCRSPDSADGNEMVFCDSCNICVHQACYGITRIPEGQWLCCTCNIHKRPECVLCPNKAGAMKCTRSGQKWAHVSCALWIPEVSIGCVEKMEPITKVSGIPASRWALICVLCRERVGACIQCSVKTCKTTYHVTCSFKHGLEMRAIIEDENADDGVKLRSYCEKHSKSSKKEKSICSGSEDDDSKRKKRKDMTSEEKNQARAIRLQEIEAEFFKHVSIKDVSIHLDVDNEALQYIYNYWKLKRKTGYNKPLLPPKSEDVDMISHKREQADLEKMKMFVQLRQDLERVRNLCYMVSRREKLSRTFFRMREQTFHKQAAVLDSVQSLPSTVVQAVIEANHGPSIYDRLYSHNEAEDHTSDFDVILARIAGIKSPIHSNEDAKLDINGLFKDVKNNPYKKIYYNGSTKRRSGSLYGSSLSGASSSGDERPKDNKENRLCSSSGDEKPSVSINRKRTPLRKNSNLKPSEKQRKKRQLISRSKFDTSSEEDIKPKKEWAQSSRSRLSQVDRELEAETCSDSDELMPIRSYHRPDNQKNVKSVSSIYSDSDSSNASMKNDDKSSNATNDSQNKLRTKAAVKEFSHKPSTSKSPNKSSPENKKKLKADMTKNENKKNYVPSDLIVPQRQAAKKATENLKSNTTSRAKDHAPVAEEQPNKTEDKSKQKIKQKSKDTKELPKEEEKIKDKKKEKESKVIHDVFDIDKEVEKSETQEILAYVPQRQAAKKAAEHIKSGLGKPIPASTEALSEPTEKPKRELETVRARKESENKKIESKKEIESKPAKVSEIKRKSSTNSTSSSSSSSSSSSDSSTSSSSDSEEESAKPQPRSESLFSTSPRETTKRSTAKDWPFLDKGPRPAASSGSSNSSDSSAPSSPRKPSSPPLPPQLKQDSPSRAALEHNTKPLRKNSDKKQPPQTSKREEQTRVRGRGRAPRGRPRTSNSGDRIRDADVRSRDLSDGQRVSVEGERAKSRKGKQPTTDELDNSPKTTAEPVKLLSSLRKADKKLKESKEPETVQLENKILERKAGKDGSTKTKSTHNKSYSSPEKNKEQDASQKRVEKSEKEKAKRDALKPITKSIEKTIIAPEKLSIPEKQKHKSPEKFKSPTEKQIKQTQFDKQSKSPEKVHKILENITEKVTPRPAKSPEKIKLPERAHKPSGKEIRSPEQPISKIPDDVEKPTENVLQITEKVVKSPEKMPKSEVIKSPNRELKQQIEKKVEPKESLPDKKLNKNKPAKIKSLDDIFPNKLSSSECKENKQDIKKPPTPKVMTPKTSDEITMADKIVDDHLLTHKAKDLYKRQNEAIQEIYSATPDITKSLLNDFEPEKKNSLKPSGITNQVLQNRSIFSPQPHAKDTDLLDFNFDDIGISKDDEIMKGPWGFNNSTLIREDTKEDSARETLNLVEKLRMELSKKSTGCDVDEATTSTEVESEKIDFSEQVVPDNTTELIQKNSEIKSGREEIMNVNMGLKVLVTEPESIRHFEEASNQHQQPQADYSYLNCDTNLSLERHKNIPIQHQSLTDHTAPAEGDERWVPPSENFPNIQSVDPSYLNDAVPHIDSHYLEQYTDMEHHKNQPLLNSIQSQLDVRLQEDSLKNQSPSLQERIDRRISQTPLIDPASLDCMPSPSPYANIHPQAKWADCEVMPNRRSSSSSAASTSSSSPRKEDDEVRLQDVRVVNHPSLDMATYLPTQVTAFPPNSLENFGAYPDGSCYPVSLFPPPNLNTQLQFPPTGPAAMFPPAFGAPFPTPHTIPPMPKPVDEALPYSSTTCTAAFTSSQHNMALTAAMVNMPPSTPKLMEQKLEEQLLAPPPELPPCSQPSLTPSTITDEVAPSPALSNATPTANSTLPSPSTSLKSNSSAGKKSPSKPTRTSARVTSQMMNKSPAKSPGKSPRQEAALKQSGPGRGRGDGKRGSGKSGAARPQTATRGRGRGRGRGRASHHNDYDYVGSGTIHTKLVGTVYDFNLDDDISNENMTDLKSMRERRKSVDIHDRKFEPFSSTRDSPRSPKFSSPSQTSHKNRGYNADLRELRPPTPIEDSRSKTDVSLTSSDNEPPQIFPDVTPVLPGPVDMRTYNSNFDQQRYSEQNLLNAFASGTTETQVHEDIDEDIEKELYSVLTAKKPIEPPKSEVAGNIKVSLSDSRNQLKVKIKGPIANYTSTVAPLPPPTVDPIVVTSFNSVTNNAINSASIGISSGGTSSLRRMRKKELLRQYWTQDMNMDDPTSNPGYIAPAAPTINRTIITIPKAVASMTSIPTKEDYRDYRTGTDDFVESKHHRKESKARPGALSRELRQLDLSLDEEGHLERRRSIGSAGSNNSGLSSSFDSVLLNKRRGRPPRLSTQQPTAPKLKIKIGTNTNSIVGATRLDDKRDRIRPPKKRLTTINMPSVEDLKRESMKFRKKVMQDLKIKKKKKDRSEKKKKKKLKSEVQIISNQGENPTKLIIRFGKKSDGDGDKRTSGESSTLNEVRTEVKNCVREAELPGDERVSDKPPLKLTPIKLKLSRCQEGSGYIMKPTIATPNAEKAEETQAVQPGQPPPNPPPPSSPPPPASLPNAVQPPTPPKKDCEVR